MTNQINQQNNDAELVRSSQEGESAAFEALTTRYERRVYSLALRMLRHQQDAEQVTQQTFLSAWGNLAGFHGDISFAAWLLRGASHAALEVIRKRKGLPTSSLDGNTEPDNRSRAIPGAECMADQPQSPEQMANGNKIRTLLERSLDQLDEIHRLVFLLRDLEGLSVKETAWIVGLSEEDVRVRLLRARLQLRDLLTPALAALESRTLKLCIKSSPDSVFKP